MQTLSPADKDYWKHIVATGNRLGLGLLPGFQGPGKAGNVVFSPTSIFVILCMLYNGACNSTYIELATALGLPQDQELNPWMRQLINYINSHEQQTLDVQLCNGLFFANGQYLHFDFANTLTESYSASLYSVDFFESNANERINAWAANATRDKITNLLPPLDPSTRFVLANAIYFLGKWNDPFEKSATRLQDFYLPDGRTAKVATMNKSSHLHYFEDNDCQSVLLPYKGGNYALQIVLPKTMQSPTNLLPRISEIATRTASNLPTYVELSLPKFSLDFRVELQNNLRALGISDLSDPNRCDLGRIGNQIYVNKILHQAMIRVDELGTEAAAATAAMMSFGSAMPPTAVRMSVDHPFLFTICDTVTGQILFLGSLYEP